MAPDAASAGTCGSQAVCMHMHSNGAVVGGARAGATLSNKRASGEYGAMIVAVIIERVHEMQLLRNGG